MINLSSIDIIEYLDTVGIQYTMHGKNVSQNWIGIQCPFCDDKSNHLGINIKSKAFSCFKCGTKGNIIKLVQELEHINWIQALNNLQQFSKTVIQFNEKITAVSNSFPKMNKLGKVHKEYLSNRGLDPDFMEKKYALKSGANFTKYQTRLIIPFFEKKRMISFTSRDVSNSIEPKYLHPSRDEVILVPKDLIFNIDSVKNSCIVTEGCFDVFKIGDGAVALSGTKYTQRQVSLLSNIERVFILFDPEPMAQKQAGRLCKELSFLTHSEVILLDIDRDPGDMTASEVKELRKELGL